MDDAEGDGGSLDDESCNSDEDDDYDSEINELYHQIPNQSDRESNRNLTTFISRKSNKASKYFPSLKIK